ncbi:MFS transporter [Actinopolymorpha alba]|uniref:MFS transporter n=1 Tax=Actinopolymorpha alba TaxID=533267 RepID=UPI0003A179D1|nr:MFS transporter [Actinopolymorpha alba]
MTTPKEATSPAVWGDRDFLLFLIARTVATVGSAVTAVALPLLVYDLSRSALLTSAVAALQVLPYLLFGLIAGAMADRLPRRPLMLCCQAASAAALISVPLVEHTARLTVTHLLTVAALLATAFVWFDAAAFGALPTLVGKDRLLAANSAVWSTTTLVGVAAPALGGAAVAALDAPGALALDAASYVIAGGALAVVGRVFGPTRPIRDRRRSQLLADIREGLAFVRDNTVVRSLTLLGLGNSVTAGAVTGLLVVLAIRDLGVREDGVGLLLVAAAAGALLAAVVLPRLVRHLPIGWVSIGALSASPPAVALLAFAPDARWAAGALLAWSLTSTLVVLNGITARQRATPDYLQARVNTTARMIAWGGTPLGALAAGALADLAGARAACALMAVPVAVSAALSWWSPLRDQAFGTTPPPPSRT